MGPTIQPGGLLLSVATWPFSRRVALAMVAYGIAGIVLAVGSLVVLAGPTSRLQAIAGHGADAIQSLDLADRALTDAQTASGGAAASLTAAERSARSAAGLFRELQAAMVGLREASNVSILGAQPLAGLGSELGGVADRSAALADDVGALATTLATEGANLSQLSRDLASLRSELVGIRQLAGQAGSNGLQDAVRSLAAMGILIAIWLTLPAVASLAAGLAILRRLPARPLRPPPGAAQQRPEQTLADSSWIPPERSGG